MKITNDQTSYPVGPAKQGRKSGATETHILEPYQAALGKGRDSCSSKKSGRIGLDECLQRRGDLRISIDCTLRHSICNIFGRVPAPSLAGVERHDLNGLGELARENVSNYTFEIGVLLVSLAPCTSCTRAKIFQHQIDVSVETVERHD